jgi:hypothetical protein
MNDGIRRIGVGQIELLSLFVSGASLFLSMVFCAPSLGGA